MIYLAYGISLLLLSSTTLARRFWGKLGLGKRGSVLFRAIFIFAEKEENSQVDKVSLLPLFSSALRGLPF